MAGLARRAYAKVNLFLDVVRRRPDGFHDIVSVFQSVALADTVCVRPRRGGRITVSCDVAGLSGRGNLCHTVARLLQKRYNIRRGAHIAVEKHIPLGSGMGGASTDAAAALLLLCRCWGLRPSSGELQELASRAGKDVPFFLRGGTCLVEGTGERLTPVHAPWARRPLWLALVWPGAPLLTTDVYRAYDALFLDGRPARRPARTAAQVRRLLRRGDVARLAFNGMESPAGALVAGVKAAKAALLAAGAAAASMTGSGSTVFGVFGSRRTAAAGARAAGRMLPGARVFVARTISGQGFFDDTAVYDTGDETALERGEALPADAADRACRAGGARG